MDSYTYNKSQHCQEYRRTAREIVLHRTRCAERQREQEEQQQAVNNNAQQQQQQHGQQNPQQQGAVQVAQGGQGMLPQQGMNAQQHHNNMIPNQGLAQQNVPMGHQQRMQQLPGNAPHDQLIQGHPQQQPQVQRAKRSHAQFIRNLTVPLIRTPDYSESLADHALRIKELNRSGPFDELPQAMRPPKVVMVRLGPHYWKCAHCAFIRASAGSVHRHTRKLHEPWRYHCGACYRLFWSAASLKAHVEKNHMDLGRYYP